MYIVVIPSYKRAQLLKEKTMKTLIEGHVNPKNIYIFVANQEEKLEYVKIFPNIKVIVGVPGITAQRKFIINYFPENKEIVSIDDDVSALITCDGTITNIDVFFKKAFKDLHDHKLKLWGVYPTPNPFYMKGAKPVTTSLKFIIGTLHGFINDHSIKTSDIKEKEDVEYSILHYQKYKGVLRYNHVSMKTKFKNPLGGLGGIEKRFQDNKDAAEYLHEKYPEYTRIKIRKNGMYEIVLRSA